MSRHRGDPGYYVHDFDDVITGSIPIPEEVRMQRLRFRRQELLADYEKWHELNLHWGSINNLIGAINDASWLLGIDEEIPGGLY